MKNLLLKHIKNLPSLRGVRGNEHGAELTGSNMLGKTAWN